MNLRPEEHADEQRGHAPDQDLAHGSRPSTRSRPTEREPLISTRSPGWASSSSSAPASSGVADRVGLAVEALGVAAARRSPTVTSTSMPSAAACSPISRWKRPSPAPSSAIAPSTAIAALGGARREVLEGRPHRHRVGVVAVVHHRHARRAARRPPRAATRSARSTRPPTGTPERPRGGHGGQRVEQVVGLARGQLELDASPARLDLGAAARRRPAAARRRPGPKVQVSRSSRAGAASSSGSLAGTTQAAPGAQVADQLGLGRRHALDRAEQLEVHRARRSRSRPRRARRSRPARRSGPRRASPSRAPAPRCRARPRGSSAAGRSRCSGSRGWRGSRSCGREQRGEDVLGRGLAGRAGDADHLGAQLAPPGARQRVQRGERVVDGDHRGAAAGECRPRRRPPRPRRACSRRRARPRRRRRARAAANSPPSALAPGRPTNRSPGLDLARVDHRARAARRARVAGRQLAAGGRGQPRGGPVDHARAPAVRAAPRAPTVTSSNGSLRPPSNSWPCSWPLPAITTTSPGLGATRSPARSRARRSTSRSASGAGARDDLVDDRLGLLASAGCRRSRSRGRPAARPPRPSAGACRGRGRRRRRTPRAARPSVSSRAARSTFSSESGVCA